MSERSDGLKPEDLKIVEGVLSQLSTHPAISPVAGRATREQAEQDYEATLLPADEDRHFKVREIDLTLHYLLGKRHPHLIPSETKRHLEVLHSQRGLAVDREAKEALEIVAYQRGRNRFNILAVNSAQAAAFLVAVILAVGSHSSYLETEYRLLQDPNYQTSKRNQDISQHLMLADWYLNPNAGDEANGRGLIRNKGPFVGDAKRELTLGIRKAVAPPLGYDQTVSRLADVRDAINDTWRPNSFDADELTAHRSFILRVQGEFQARASQAESNAPQDLLFQRNNFWNQFLGWTAASGALLLLGLAQALPKDLYRRIYQDLKGNS